MFQVLQETTKGVKHFLKKDFCSFFGQIATWRFRLDASVVAANIKNVEIYI
jgi:hypothetical protein